MLLWPPGGGGVVRNNPEVSDMVLWPPGGGGG